MSGCLDVVKMFSFLQTHVPCTLLKKMQIANRGPDCIIQYSRHSWTEKLMIFIGADVRKKKKNSNVHGNSVAFSVLKAFEVDFYMYSASLYSLFMFICRKSKWKCWNAAYLRRCQSIFKNPWSWSHKCSRTYVGNRTQCQPENFIYSILT